MFACVLGSAGAAHGQTAGTYLDPNAGRMVTQGDWGGVGLMQTRTARFGGEGMLDVGYSFANPNKRYTININYFSWVEATFRYTEVRNIFYGDASFSGDQRYKDRGADVKFRLLSERRFLPAISIGMQDMLGTGLFAGEYLVATKRFGDFDFSLGLGWGYNGSAGNLSNPLIHLSPPLENREGNTGPGGQIGFLSFFGGKTMGVFGGVEYSTPLQGLTLKLEYDGHRYLTEDPIETTVPAASPINLGFVYRPYPWFEISLGRERGNTSMARFTLKTDLQTAGKSVPKLDPPPQPVGPRPSLATLVGPELADVRPAPAPIQKFAAEPLAPPVAVRPPASVSACGIDPIEALSTLGLAVESFSLVGTEAVITASRWTGNEDLRAAASAVLSCLPADVGAATLIELVAGTERARARATRQQATIGTVGLFERMAAAGANVEDVALTGTTAVVTVSPRDGRTPIDLSLAARIAAEELPGVGTVTARNAATGVAETWLAFADRPRSPVVPLYQAVPPVGLAFDLTRPLATAGQDQRQSGGGGYSSAQRKVMAWRLQRELASVGAVLEALDVNERTALVSVTAFRFRQFSRNLGLVARVVANNLPASVEEITIAALNGGMEMNRITFVRSDLERATAVEGAPDEFWLHARIDPGAPWQPGDEVSGRYPRLSWSIAPQLRQHIGGPDQFYLYQLWLSGLVNVDVMRGLQVTAQVGKNIYHNFDKIRLNSTSVLPHVRSDIKEYLQEGADNLVRLQANYMFKPAEDLYARVTAGLLEEMYGGISTELLYRPLDSRIALGVEVDWLRQRDFDQRFAFREYQTQTSHFSIYYETPYEDVLVAAHIGQYLAGDRGVTFDVSRRFESGVRVGAWATFTNVSPQRFGEGSFDKGFFITIPFELFLTRSTTSSGVFAFRPLSRDGGQRVVVAPRLYDLTAGQASKGAILRDWPELLR